MKGLLSSLDFHKSFHLIIIVFIVLLHFPSLLKQGLGCSSTLVFQNLLFFQIRSFRSLKEFIPVVLVSFLQVLEGIGQSFNFLLALPDLAVQLISIPLLFLSFLGCLDHVVSLRPLPNILSVSRLLLLQPFKLDLQILDLALTFLKLYSDQVPFFFCCLEL
jgi:hypothetical protein